MKIAGVIQTGSDDTWYHWTITGAHPDSTPWVLMISTEIDGRHLEIDHIYNMADEQVADALAEWLTQSITRSGGRIDLLP